MLLTLVASTMQFESLDDKVEKVRSKILNTRQRMKTYQANLQTIHDKATHAKNIDDRLKSAPIGWGAFRIPLLCDVKLGYLKLRKRAIGQSITKLSDAIQHADTKLKEVEYMISDGDASAASEALEQLSECTGLG